MKFLDLNGVSILWARIKETFARKSETVSDISRDDTTFTVTRADGTTFEFTQKDTTYDVATTTASGLMSAADKAKLNGVESGAQENVIESVSVNGTEQSVTDKGIDITVPTALSDLTDDVGYLTNESDPTVPTWAKQPQKPAYTASEVGALPANTHIPTDVSELNNDAGYIDDQYVDDAIATALADISGIKYHVCATDEYDHLTFLPTVEGEAGTIYLVPKPLSEAGRAIVGKSVTKSELSKSNSAFAGYSIVRSQENSADSTQNDNNYYYEYIYNNSAFELIGDTQVSLDGYLKNNDIAAMSDVEQMLIKIGLDE